MREQALLLFTERGYEATTVEQIAAAAGVSHMTFFRYFPTKEDVVLSDSYDPLLVSSIRARPRTEHPVTRIHRAVRERFGVADARVADPGAGRGGSDGADHRDGGVGWPLTAPPSYPG